MGAHTTTSDKLAKLLAHHKAIVAALETTIGLLSGEATVKAATNGHVVLANAIALDQQRRTKKPKKSHPKATIKEQRQRSADVLASFDTTKPSPLGGKLGSLVRRGYLRKKGDGYIRTAKEYTV